MIDRTFFCGLCFGYAMASSLAGALDSHWQKPKTPDWTDG